MSDARENLAAIAAGLDENHSLCGELCLDFGVRVLVRSNSPELLENLGSYFTGFCVDGGVSADIDVVALQNAAHRSHLDYTVKPPEPGKTKIKEEYAELDGGRAVRKRLTGMVFYFGGPFNYAVGPCLENDNQVVNFINNRLIQWELDRGALLAHAAAVTDGVRGLAVAGFSGMGKSTLALHLVSRGLTFVSNDRLLLRGGPGGPTMRGVPKLPRINPGTALNNPDLIAVIPPEEREEFTRLEEDEIWDLEHKYDVRIDRVFGPDRFRLAGGFDGLAVLNWRRGGGPPALSVVDVGRRTDLLEAVRKSPGVFYLPGGGETDLSQKAYLRLLSGVRVMEIGGGVDFARAADMCLEEMGLTAGREGAACA